MTTERAPAAPEPFAVVGGGVPSHAELAAIAAALHPAAGQDDEVARATGVPAWTRAALVEATTAVTITSPSELRP